MLGAPRFLDEEMEERTKDPGVAIGLAWTPAGGEVLFIEASRMAGTGSLTLTGQLGDVMKESARAALSWLRTHAKEYGIDPDFFKNAEMHVHVPSGAIPKDGPSAGVTMATAMASVLTGPAGARRHRDDRRDHAVRPRAADRRHQGEGARGAARRHPRSDRAEAERQERQRGSDAGAARGADRPPRVDHRRSARARAAAGLVRRAAGRRQEDEGRSKTKQGEPDRRSPSADAAVRRFATAASASRLLAPVSHRYRAARLSHPQIPAGARASARDAASSARRRRRAATRRPGTSSRSCTPPSTCERCATGRCRAEDDGAARVAVVGARWSKDSG